MKTRNMMLQAAAVLSFGAVGLLVSIAHHGHHVYHTTSPIAEENIPTPMVKPDPASVPRPVHALVVSDEAIELITRNEGLELEPYQFNGKWYIGYGHGRTARPDMRITREDALSLLRDDLRAFEDDVRRLVKVPLTEGQFSALVSFVYNTGEGTFARSSVLRHINNGDMEAAADALMLYTKAVVNGEKTELRSLVKRRSGERRLFLGSEEEKREREKKSLRT